MARPTAPSRMAKFVGAAAIAAATVLLSGCSLNEALYFDLPDPATAEGAGIANLWQGAWIAAWLVGLLTWGLMLWASFMYLRRWRRNREMPAQTAYNVPLEILYTMVPLVMIVGLFFFTLRVQTPVVAVENNQKETINVLGYRWSWAFNYQYDNPDGAVKDGVYDEGTPDVLPTLWLPVDEKVKFELTTPDVIHSFWIPDFLFKMDVIPGKMNVFELTPNKTGTFIGRCAELCGTYHSQMLFSVKVVPRAEYEQHLKDLAALGQVGKISSPRVITEGERESERNNL